MFGQRLAGIGAAALLLAGAAGARGQDAGTGMRASTAAVRRAVVGVIRDQLAAFRSHDLDMAYAYAAPALQRQVPEADFMAIVQRGYRQIWDNRGAEYGIVRDDGGEATVTVRVIGRDGSAQFDYVLAKVGTVWRISGVLRHRPQPEEGL